LAKEVVSESSVEFILPKLVFRKLKILVEKLLKDFEDNLLWRMFSILKVNSVANPSSPVIERLIEVIAVNIF
jgi:hypothetical protein